jgi:hypothetical protein
MARRSLLRCKPGKSGLDFGGNFSTGNDRADSKLGLADFEVGFDFLKGQLRRVDHLVNMAVPADDVQPAAWRSRKVRLADVVIKWIGTSTTRHGRCSVAAGK